MGLSLFIYEEFVLTFNIDIEQAFLLSSELGKLRVLSLLTNVGKPLPATQRRKTKKEGREVACMAV